MGKKKKTLRQKKLTEQRRLTEPHGQIVSEEIHQDNSTPSTSISYSFSKTKTAHAHTQSYSLSHDLRKTFFVSLGILLFLVVFSTILHKYSLVLPLVSGIYK